MALSTGSVDAADQATDRSLGRVDAAFGFRSILRHTGDLGTRLASGIDPILTENHTRRALGHGISILTNNLAQMGSHKMSGSPEGEIRSRMD